jgi:DNA-binding NtrC family response regulator
VRLEGAITERAELRSCFQSLSGAVVLDLQRVTKITSFGVREWISALVELWKCQYAFVRCPPSIMTQFNVVTGFGGQGELISFYAPYVCERCSEEHCELIDLRGANGANKALLFAAREVRCKCGGNTVLNEIPEHFFAYASSRPKVQLSPDLEQLIHAELGGSSESLTIRKEVAGQVTALWISGPLTEHANMRRPLEDLEGFILADLSRVTAATPEGVQRLRDIFRTLEVRHLAFVKVRPELVPMLAHLALPFPTAIVSVLERSVCGACKTTTDQEISCAQLYGVEPTLVACPSCGALRRLVISGEVLNLAWMVAREIPAEIVEYRLGPRTVIAEPQRSHPAARAIRLSPTPASFEFNTVVGASGALRTILETIDKVSSSDATVLLRGETGTGKEMLARLLHVKSDRRTRPFVAVNCAALAPGVIESELFGHERGAFTGATARHLGRFERAHQGTLFIDEIGDVPLEVQVKLLRAVQEHRVERLGGSDSIAVDIRLVAATHRPLEEMMREGSFREDLFYRLNVIPIVVPPLRERVEDIWLLAQYYLVIIQQRLGKSGIRFSEAMRGVLESYSWPGNIRELINVVERAVALTPSNEVAEVPQLEPATLSSHAAPRTPPSGSAGNLKEAVGEYERRLILEALASSHGNRTRAAKELGISRQALGMKLAKYGLS